MSFIVVFNIIISVSLVLGLTVILATFVLSRDVKGASGEKAERQANMLRKVRAVTYLAVFAVMILMIVVNLIV